MIVECLDCDEVLADTARVDEFLDLHLVLLHHSVRKREADTQLDMDRVTFTATRHGRGV